MTAAPPAAARAARESRNPSAVLYGPRDVRIEDRPVPVPGAGQVRVRVCATGICGSDVHYYTHGRIGGHVVEGPMIIGHESAGTIDAIGAGVDPARVGQPVAVEPGVPCGRCAQCRAGRYNLCPDVRFFATPPVDGSVTGWVVIDDGFAHRVPGGLTYEQAAMAEPVSVGVAAARKARLTAGDRVLVTGAGPVGLFAAQVARAFGAAHVVVSDVNPHRLRVAAALGFATPAPGERPGPPFDVVLECSGAAAAVDLAVRRAAPAARIVLVGMGQDRLTVDVAAVQSREIGIVGLFRYAGTYPTALGMIASGAVQTEPVITHRFRVEDAEAALTLGSRDPRALKAVVLADPAEPAPTRTAIPGGVHRRI